MKLFVWFLDGTELIVSADTREDALCKLAHYVSIIAHPGDKQIVEQQLRDILDGDCLEELHESGVTIINH